MARYAAIDIGSNSIRMEAAEVVAGQPPRVLASEREVTRLGESVFRTGAVSEEALKTTCAVLARMAALYRRLDVVGVRAVATSAIRDTRNQAEFLERASEAAGTHVEIISGREEARLIHLGVESNWPQSGKRVLILDIGGGSAEIVASEDGRLREAYSKPLGAVRLHEIFLQDDPPSPRQLHQMHEFIQEKLVERGAAPRKEQVGPRHRHFGHGVGRGQRGGAGAALAARGNRPAAHLRPRRCAASTGSWRNATWRRGAGSPASVRGARRSSCRAWPCCWRSCRSFICRRCITRGAGVRDGIIADLAARNVGAELSRLTREQRREVEDMGRRYGVSIEHARNVAHIANLLFTALQPLHHLPPATGKLLEAAAYLIDVGHYVSSTSHHKHSYYVVVNSDMPGFTERERLLVAALCRYHRKTLPSSVHTTYQSLTAEERRTLLLLIPLLRLADNMVRSPKERIQKLECRAQNGDVALVVHSNDDIDLEQWGAERASETFRQIYGRTVSVTKARD